MSKRKGGRSKGKKTARDFAKDPRTGTMALWIETPFGPLYPCIRPPKTVADGDTQTMQVRARRREYLDKFKERWAPTAGPVLTGEEVTGHRTDYPYRCYISPADMAAAVGAMILATDSEKFKPLVDGPEGLDDPALRSKLHGVYTACWSRQLDLSDGTSSYDWTPGKYAKAVTSKPDPDAPVKVCRESGHYFSRQIWVQVGTADSGSSKRDFDHMGCYDCSAVLDVKANTFTYPDGKSARKHEPAPPVYPGGTSKSYSTSYGTGNGLPAGSYEDGHWTPADEPAGTSGAFQCCKHCVPAEAPEGCLDKDQHTEPCSLGCNQDPDAPEGYHLMTAGETASDVVEGEDGTMYAADAAS